MDKLALTNDQEEAMRIVLDARQAGIWTSMPGIVQSVDLTKMTVSVQPAVQVTVQDIDGNVSLVNLPLLIHVPIIFPRAGGFVITFPIAVGDEVLVCWASRCIDAWWQSGGIQAPMEARMHDLSDGFAIPGPSSLPNVPANISTTGLQIRNAAKTTYIELAADGKIKIVSSSEIDVTGDLKVTGDINATGDIVAGTVSLKTHVHSGVTSGSSNSGPPV